MKKLILFLIAAANFLAAQDSIIFVIRVDDIQSRNTSYVPKSILPFQDSVMKRGGKVTWGVIPHRFLETQNVDGAFAKELKSSFLLGNEIALHGYNHVCTFCGETGHEMYCQKNLHGFSFTEQDKFIKDGLVLLKDTLGITPQTFIAPGHYLDSTTYDVLINNKFSYVSGSKQERFIKENLYDFPIQAEHAWALTASNYKQQLTNALLYIKDYASSNGYYNMLFHDPFVRTGYLNNIVPKWTGELLDSVLLMFDGKVKFMTVAEAGKYFAEKTLSVDKDNIINAFELKQNYPNPFNPITTIEFTLANNSNVELKVYNILGKEAANLINEHKTKGAYSIKFNASDLPSGVYIYQLRTEKGIFSKKMMLVK